jgi:hypothetical protein
MSHNQSTNQSWHATHAINAGNACDLSTAGCPVDQVLEESAGMAEEPKQLSAKAAER